MINPKISVLITAYNAEKFIKQTIQSILNQTYNNYEIIIVDNKSKDKTIEIINSFANNKILLKCLDKNYGQTFALNIGLKLSKGEYIARIDADDIAAPERILKQVYYMKKNQLDFLSSQVKYIDEKGKILSHSNFYPLGNNILLILLSNPISHSSVMIKRKNLIEVGGYNENFKYWQDLELWLKLFKNSKFGIFPEHLTSIRIHQNQISKSTDVAFLNKRNNEWIDLINKNLKNENINLNLNLKVLLIIKRDTLYLLSNFKFISLLKLLLFILFNLQNLFFNKYFYLVFTSILKNRLKFLKIF